MQFSALIGTNFADGRGNVMLGANYADRSFIFARDRDWRVAGWEDPGTTGGGIGSSNLSQYVVDAAGPFGPGNPPATGFPLVGANYVIDQNGNVFDSSDPLNAANPYTGPLGNGTNFKINPDGTLGYNDRAHSYYTDTAGALFHIRERPLCPDR